MTVQQLIDALSKFNPEHTICAEDSQRFLLIGDIYESPSQTDSVMIELLPTGEHDDNDDFQNKIKRHF